MTKVDTNTRGEEDTGEEEAHVNENLEKKVIPDIPTGIRLLK